MRLFGAPDVDCLTSASLKAKSIKYHEDFNAIINSLGICHFPALSLMLKKPERAPYMEHYAKNFLSSDRDKDVSEEFAMCGERAVCLEKAFNDVSVSLGEEMTLCTGSRCVSPVPRD